MERFDYEEKCIELAVEKDPELSVLEFHLLEHMIRETDFLGIFLSPAEFIDVFFGQKYVKDELANKILDREVI